MDQVGNDFKEQDYIGKEFIAEKFVDEKRILSCDRSYDRYLGESGVIQGFHESHYPKYVRVKFALGEIHFPLEAIQDQFKANLEKETPEYLQKLYIDVFKITRKICIKKKR
jgi:hypothetical protein